MDAPSLTDAVRRELLAHPDVTEAAHRFGGVVFHVGRHEIGHLHGERVADLPFAPAVRDDLAARGRISPEHLASDSKWISRRVDEPGDVAAIVELFRVSYEHAAQAEQASRRAEEQEPVPEQKRRWRDSIASSRSILRRRGRG